MVETKRRTFIFFLKSGKMQKPGQQTKVCSRAKNKVENKPAKQSATEKQSPNQMKR